MISSFFQNGFSTNAFIQFLMMIPIILISLSFHEMSHGYAAYLCGDKTAKNFGRLTMNPIKHLDPIGLLMMLIFGFGWAKPVPVNTRNFKNFKRDLAIVSIAGPLSNLLLAFLGIALLFISGAIMGAGLVYLAGDLGVVILNFFYLFASLNVGLAVFNLIPVPPLDGSRIISSILPSRLAYSYTRIEQYARYFFLIVLLSSYIPFDFLGFSSLADLLFYPISWLRETIINGMIRLFSLIF